jgi:hypothetical protein
MSEKLPLARLDMPMGKPRAALVSRPSHGSLEADTARETEMTARLMETLESQLRSLQQQMAELDQRLGVRH